MIASAMSLIFYCRWLKMIDKYKKISIIYGGSGVECAREINNRLKKLHDEEMFPVKSHIIANQILGGSNIFRDVKDAISQSALSIIILTFDDVNGTRIRQNVLIELGMALMTVPHTDNCIFLSEKYPLPDDFPSDLKGWINPNYFDKNNLNEIADKVCSEVKRMLGCRSHSNILSSQSYLYDYGNILNDIPNSIFEEKSDIQLEHILDCWQDNIASFDFVSERIMYVAERIKFFPDFNSNNKFFAFLNNVRGLIKAKEIDYDKWGASYINTACTLIDTILDYTDIKLRKDVIRCMKDPKSNLALAEECAGKFSAIVYKLQKIINKTEDRSKEYNYNWLLLTLAYEYLALAKMKVLNFVDSYSDDNLNTLNYVIACYEKVIEISEDYGGPSSNLWLGYAQYDLTRAYEYVYRITGNTDILEKIRNYSHSSIVTRRDWCKINSFKGVFTNALSFEYFLVRKHELEMRFTIDGYSPTTKTQMIKDIESLDEELKQYCDSVELGRLYDMKSSIDEFHKKVRN